ncbi:DUF2190 family protein [Haemophilus parahaemolyticus]|jgi:hypothetical protein
MAKNYIQDGNTIRFSANQNIKSGDVVMVNELAAVAITDVATGDDGVGLTVGVFTVKAKQADDIKQGDVLYWSESEGATKTAGSNKRLGIAWRNSGTMSAEVDVKINA